LALDLPAAAVEIADDVAEILLRRYHFDLHHRLEDLDAGLLRRFAHRTAAGDLERQRRGVDVVILAVEQVNRKVDDRNADQRTRFSGLAHALLDRRNIFLRDVAALDLIEELKASAALAGDDLHLHFAELARAARLLLVGVGELDRLREIFAIGDLRSADIGLDLELALHAVDEDLEVKLAHPLDDRL